MLRAAASITRQNLASIVGQGRAKPVRTRTRSPLSEIKPSPEKIIERLKNFKKTPICISPLEGSKNVYISRMKTMVHQPKSQLSKERSGSSFKSEGTSKSGDKTIKGDDFILAEALQKFKLLELKVTPEELSKAVPNLVFKGSFIQDLYCIEDDDEFNRVIQGKDIDFRKDNGNKAKKDVKETYEGLRALLREKINRIAKEGNVETECPELQNRIGNGEIEDLFIKTLIFIDEPKIGDESKTYQLGNIDISVGKMERPYRFADEISLKMEDGKFYAYEGNLVDAVALFDDKVMHTDNHDDLNTYMIKKYWARLSDNWVINSKLSNALYNNFGVREDENKSHDYWKNLKDQFHTQLEHWNSLKHSLFKQLEEKAIYKGSQASFTSTLTTALLDLNLHLDPGSALAIKMSEDIKEKLKDLLGSKSQASEQSGFKAISALINIESGSWRDKAIALAYSVQTGALPEDKFTCKESVYEDNSHFRIALKDNPDISFSFCLPTSELEEKYDPVIIAQHMENLLGDKAPFKENFIRIYSLTEKFKQLDEETFNKDKLSFFETMLFITNLPNLDKKALNALVGKSSQEGSLLRESMEKLKGNLTSLDTQSQTKNWLKNQINKLATQDHLKLVKELLDLGDIPLSTNNFDWEEGFELTNILKAPQPKEKSELPTPAILPNKRETLITQEEFKSLVKKKVNRDMMLGHLKKVTQDLITKFNKWQVSEQLPPFDISSEKHIAEQDTNNLVETIFNQHINKEKLGRNLTQKEKDNLDRFAITLKEGAIELTTNLFTNDFWQTIVKDTIDELIQEKLNQINGKKLANFSRQLIKTTKSDVIIQIENTLTISEVASVDEEVTNFISKNLSSMVREYSGKTLLDNLKNEVESNVKDNFHNRLLGKLKAALTEQSKSIKKKTEAFVNQQLNENKELWEETQIETPPTIEESKKEESEKLTEKKDPLSQDEFEDAVRKEVNKQLTDETLLQSLKALKEELILNLDRQRLDKSITKLNTKTTESHLKNLVKVLVNEIIINYIKNEKPTRSLSRKEQDQWDNFTKELKKSAANEVLTEFDIRHWKNSYQSTKEKLIRVELERLSDKNNDDLEDSILLQTKEQITASIVANIALSASASIEEKVQQMIGADLVAMVNQHSTSALARGLESEVIRGVRKLFDVRFQDTIKRKVADLSSHIKAKTRDLAKVKQEEMIKKTWWDMVPSLGSLLKYTLPVALGSIAYQTQRKPNPAGMIANYTYNQLGFNFNKVKEPFSNIFNEELTEARLQELVRVFPEYQYSSALADVKDSGIRFQKLVEHLETLKPALIKRGVSPDVFDTLAPVLLYPVSPGISIQLTDDDDKVKDFLIELCDFVNENSKVYKFEWHYNSHIKSFFVFQPQWANNHFEKSASKNTYEHFQKLLGQKDRDRDLTDIVFAATVSYFLSGLSEVEAQLRTISLYWKANSEGDLTYEPDTPFAMLPALFEDLPKRYLKLALNSIDSDFPDVYFLNGLTMTKEAAENYLEVDNIFYISEGAELSYTKFIALLERFYQVYHNEKIEPFSSSEKAGQSDAESDRIFFGKDFVKFTHKHASIDGACFLDNGALPKAIKKAWYVRLKSLVESEPELNMTVKELNTSLNKLTINANRVAARTTEEIIALFNIPKSGLAFTQAGKEHKEIVKIFQSFLDWQNPRPKSNIKFLGHPLQKYDIDYTNLERGFEQLFNQGLTETLVEKLVSGYPEFSYSSEFKDTNKAMIRFERTILHLQSIIPALKERQVSPEEFGGLAPTLIFATEPGHGIYVPNNDKDKVKDLAEFCRFVNEYSDIYQFEWAYIEPIRSFYVFQREWLAEHFKRVGYIDAFESIDQLTKGYNLMDSLLSGYMAHLFTGISAIEAQLKVINLYSAQNKKDQIAGKVFAPIALLPALFEDLSSLDTSLGVVADSLNYKGNFLIEEIAKGITNAKTLLRKDSNYYISKKAENSCRKFTQLLVLFYKKYKDEKIKPNEANTENSRFEPSFRGGDLVRLDNDYGSLNAGLLIENENIPLSIKIAWFEKLEMLVNTHSELDISTPELKAMLNKLTFNTNRMSVRSSMSIIRKLKLEPEDLLFTEAAEKKEIAQRTMEALLEYSNTKAVN